MIYCLFVLLKRQVVCFGFFMTIVKLTKIMKICHHGNLELYGSMDIHCTYIDKSLNYQCMDICVCTYLHTIYCIHMYVSDLGPNTLHSI